MVNGLASMVSHIGHDPISGFINAKLSSDLAKNKQQVTGEQLVFLIECGDVDDFLFGNHQHMNGSLRGDIVKRQTLIVFVNDVRIDLTVNDLLEYGLVAHRIILNFDY